MARWGPRSARGPGAFCREAGAAEGNGRLDLDQGRDRPGRRSPKPAPTHSPAPRPAQIILIRHAEKPADLEDPHLSRAGVRRAERLVSFITTDPVMTRFGLPVAVFATQTTKQDNGQRTQETVAPLAGALKLPVQTPYLGKDYAALARLILGNPAYAGKTVLICWNHEEIPQLV